MLADSPSPASVDGHDPFTRSFTTLRPGPIYGLAMQARCQRPFLAALLIAMAAGEARASPAWHWQDAFARQERARLVAWIERAQAGLEALVGALPFPYDVHFHRLADRGEPVPWANTSKHGDSRAVKFYVDPAYDQQAFLDDWTAGHELTHLLFPYLGRDGMWFAEGIASYLQYQVLFASGTISWPEAIDRYAERFARARAMERAGTMPIVDLSRVVRRTHSYVRLYWGGAAYFLEADRRLAMEHGLRLHDVIRDYLACCFGQGADAMAMIQLFDRISRTNAFSATYEATVVREGFPAYGEALSWLARHAPTTAGGPGGPPTGAP